MWLITTTTDGEHAVAVGEGETVLGREEGCTLTLDDTKVSRRHAAARLLLDGRVEIRDLGSSNGTWVGEERITAPVALGDGQSFRVGQTVVRVSAAAPGGATTIEPAPAPPAGAPAAAAAGAAAGAGAGAAAAAGAGTPAGSRSLSIAQRSQSAIERIRLGKAVKTATIVAAGAIVLGAIAIALLLVFVVFKKDDKPLTTAQIVKQVAPSTVLVIADVGGKRAGNGTGWVLDAKQGLIVTNAHVVNAGETFEIGVDGKNRPASVVASAPCEDLAVLKVADTSGLKTLPLVKSQSSLQRGDQSIAVGFPGTASNNDDLTATQGVVSRTKTTFDVRASDVPEYRNVILTDTAINPGNSGGPLVNSKGELIGVNSASENTKQNQNYAIGVDRVREITDKLRTGQSIGWTGMNLEYPSLEALLKNNLPVGLLVQHVTKGTPAANAGLGQDPLILTAINGKSVSNDLPSYCEAIKSVAPGQSGTFSFATGPSQTIDVPLKAG